MFETCCIYHFRENNEKLSPGGKKPNFAEVQSVPEKCTEYISNNSNSYSFWTTFNKHFQICNRTQTVIFQESAMLANEELANAFRNTVISTIHMSARPTKAIGSFTHLGNMSYETNKL